LATASAFFIPATASAPVIGAVVLADLTAPPAAMAARWQPCSCGILLRNLHDPHPLERLNGLIQIT